MAGTRIRAEINKTLTMLGDQQFILPHPTSHELDRQTSSNGAASIRYPVGPMELGVRLLALRVQHESHQALSERPRGGCEYGLMRSCSQDTLDGFTRRKLESMVCIAAI